jgi:hypothetical protein
LLIYVVNYYLLFVSFIHIILITVLVGKAP